MRKRGIIAKKAAALMLGAALVAGTLSGCEYESVDEYLEALGMLDPSEETGVVLEPIDGTELPMQDVAGENTDATDEQESSEQASSADSSTEEQEEELPTDLISEEESLEVVEESGLADQAFSSAYKTPGDSGSDEAVQKARADMGLTDAGIAELKMQQQGLYAYERLTDSGKTLYVEMLAILQNMGSDVTVSTTSDDAIELVFEYVMADHPEIFYVDGYQYTNYSMGDTITRVSFTGNYLYGQEEVKRRQTLINDEVNKCLAGAPSSEDDYYAIKYVYEYLIGNTEYDINAQDNQNICSVFLNKRSVCNGYAKAAQLLLNKLGIQCTLVTGTVNTRTSTGVRHAWDLVLCNNAYYYLDVTWGDSSYQTASGESADASKLPEVNYDYLNVSTAEIKRNHTISDIIAMPLCNSMVDNFYVRENEYFTTDELALVKDLFNRRYSEGSNNVTIKCSTDAVYDSLFQKLVTDRQVFDYLQGDTSQISYTTFKETRTIIFWL